MKIKQSVEHFSMGLYLSLIVDNYRGEPILECSFFIGEYMTKDAYYFPHFYNARQDRKLRRVRKELGVEGYGIYFMILEVLREQSDFTYPTEDIDLLADDFGTSEQKVSTVISNYDLFEVNKELNFFSVNLIKHLQPYLEKSQRAKLAAEKRWSKHRLAIDSDAKAMQMHSKCNADQNAIRIDKIKEEDIIIDKKIVKETKTAKPKKHKYGEYSNILLSDKEALKLQEEWGDKEFHRMIAILDEGIELKGYVYKSHALALRSWKKKEGTFQKPVKQDNFKTGGVNFEL